MFNIFKKKQSTVTTIKWTGSNIRQISKFLDSINISYNFEKAETKSLEVKPEEKAYLYINNIGGYIETGKELFIYNNKVYIKQ